MNRIANILARNISVMVFIASLCACSDDLNYNRNSNGSDEISFFIDNSNYSELGSRANDNCIYPSLGLTLNGKDSVYFHTDVTNHISTDVRTETRGVPISNENFVSVVNDINVDAYINGVSPYFLNYKISKQNHNIWIGSEKKYWPKQKNERLNFYCSAMLPDGTVISNNAGKTEIEYSVPQSEDNLYDAQCQPDLLFRNVEYSYEEVNKLHEGNVPLQMRHALAAISFKVGDFTKGTVKSISIRNACKSGKMSYHEELILDSSEQNEYRPVFEWELDDENTTTFTQTFNIPVDDYIDTNEETELTQKNPSTTFMLLPQELDNVEFSVVFEIGTGTEAETVVLSAPASKFGNITSWEAGKHYEYTLSSSSINWTYVFSISDNTNGSTLDFENGNQIGNCVVKSYRYRTGNKSFKEFVPWKVEAGSAKDMDSESTNNEPKLPSQWIQKWDKSGEGSVDGEKWNIEVKPNRLIKTSFGGDDTLRNNTVKGTESPYDLSSGKKNTANCYVVNSAGTYSFPAVYGNAYKNGAENEDALTLFEEITGGKPEINGIADAVVLWMDGLGIIENVEYVAADKMIVFSINKDQIQQANAVIAVRNAKKEILWSWHIWVYENDLTENAIEIDDYDSADTTYKLMNCNIGRCDDKTSYYARREGSLNFIQEGSGKEVKLNVILHEFENAVTDINSTLYQWGRKDPFTSVVNISKLVANKSETPKFKNLYPRNSDFLITDGNPYMSNTGAKSIKESILHPNEIYRDYNKSWMSEIVKEAWAGTKTIFDPCPIGFRVPNIEVFKIFSKDGNSHETRVDTIFRKDDKGEFVKDKFGNKIVDHYIYPTVAEGKSELNTYLNGSIKVDGDSNDPDVRKYSFYGKKNKGGKEFELISTGMRPFSATISSFNCLVLWSCDADGVSDNDKTDNNKTDEVKNNAFAFRVGYENKYVIHLKASVPQACVYPIRPIVDK